jgi:hypothetical protein
MDYRLHDPEGSIVLRWRVDAVVRTSLARVAVRTVLRIARRKGNVRRLRRLVGERVHEVGRLSDAEVLDRVARWLTMGFLEADREPTLLWDGSLAGFEEEAFDPYKDALGPRELTWIEIMVLDEAGDPVQQLLYEVLDPDGNVHTGRTNARGLARIAEMSKGLCSIRFPEKDRDAWEVIECPHANPEEDVGRPRGDARAHLPLAAGDSPGACDAAFGVRGDRAPAAAPGARPPPTGAGAPTPAAAVPTTWIEIQLVDMFGEPVRGASYAIVTADGTVASGQTDAAGLARIEGIPSGDARIRFPDLDAEAWEPVP